MVSIFIQEEGECFLCKQDGRRIRHKTLHKHHIFGGSNRKKSEKYGLTVRLCPECHVLGKNAVHLNADRMKELRQIGQKSFEEVYPELNFREIFGKNYL